MSFVLGWDAAATPDETIPFLAAAAAVSPLSSLARAPPASEAQSTASQAGRVRATAGVTLVLVAHAFERIAFFALTTSMVYFLTSAPLCWSDGHATTAGLTFAAVAFVSSAPGGLLGDFVISRYGAAMVGYIFYTVSYVLLVALSGMATALPEGAVPEKNASAFSCEQLRPFPGPQQTAGVCGSGTPTCGALLICAGLCVAIAQGIVHTNLVAFGADQVRHHGKAMTRCYFSLLYWMRNVGALVDVAGLSYLQHDDLGFFFNNIASLAFLILSAAIFGAGYKCYIRHQPNKPAIKKFFRIPLDALRLKRQASNRRWPNGSPNSILDHAKVYYGGSHHDKAVEEVKASGRMLIVFFLLICYTNGFSEVVTGFQVQGLHMITPRTTKAPIPPGLLLVFDSLSVLIAIPLLNNVVYPFLGRRGYQVTLHIRISAGMLFATLSFCTAGVIETVRLSKLASGIMPQTIGRTIYDAAPMSVMFQIPQYFLLGISEAFVLVTAMEYTYLFAPKALRSTMIGVLLALPGIAPFISSWLHQIYAKEFGSTYINDSHMDCVFYTFAVIQLFGSIAFYLIGRCLPLGLEQSTVLTVRRLPTQLLETCQ